MTADVAARPLRVAMISYGFGPYCVPIANALADESDVCLVLAESSLARAGVDVDERVELNSFPYPRLRRPVAQLRLARRLLRIVERFEPDVVHVQQGHLWFNLALPSLRRYPLVITVHDANRHPGDRLSAKTPWWLMRFGWRRADRLIVHAAALVPLVQAQLGPRPAVDVIPHVRLAGPPPPDVPVEPLILFFGRIWPYKGLDYLIRAEPLVTAEVPEATFAIAGEGEDFEPYRSLMTHPDRFDVRNEFIGEAESAELFTRASIVALPYVEASQSGVVPLAYLYGKPVVATNVGGLPEFVEDGRTGLIVPPHDERALAEALVRLLRDPELGRRLGENGRRKLEGECSPRAVADRTLDVYRAAIAERRTESG